MAGPQAPLLRRVLQLYEETKAEQFPSVKDMAIGEILRRLRSGDGSLVMVDWRTPGEVLPSLLPGAVLKRDFLRAPEQYLASSNVDVVFYCAIGGRSGHAVQVRSGGWLNSLLISLRSSDGFGLCASSRRGRHSWSSIRKSASGFTTFLAA
eukprot:scaffold8550_cov267-Pinguiococcus_pyrenoidosus.AAC.2